MSNLRRDDRRFDYLAVKKLTREQLAERAQSLRDRGQPLEALWLVQEWRAARKVHA